VKIAPATPDRWDDLVDLFMRRGPRGGAGLGEGGCWCMWWRERTGSRKRNRRAMGALVKGGHEPGLLAYEDGVPVGWVSVAPRDDFGQLMRSKHYGPGEEEEGVWSIVCFHVHATARHRGVARALLEAAVEHALRNGAGAIEAYPHERRADYMGSQEMFEAAGFRAVRSAGVRTVVRYPAPRHRGQSTSRPRARSATQSRRRTPPTRRE
jgi:ribosomal protein S18 acetylase RimI-like enzyme